jgi:signal transduction histidine kinase
MNRTGVDISDAIDRVIETVVVQAAEKNITLGKSVMTGNIIISADRDRLDQILLNFTDNAVKVTEKGEIEIGAVIEGGKNCIFFIVSTIAP